MTSELVVLDGSTFFVSDGAGDVRGEGLGGFFFQDVRHLSSWALSVDGAPMRVLTSRVVDYYSARVFGTLPTARLGHNPPISIRGTASSPAGSTKTFGFATMEKPSNRSVFSSWSIVTLRTSSNSSGQIAFTSARRAWSPATER